MNRGILGKVILVLLLLLIPGLFLLRTYWIYIVPILEEILKTLRETRISYFILAISVYLLSVYLFAVRWRQALFCVGYDIKATRLVPIYFGAILINNITPADPTGGEPLRILLVNKRFGISYIDAFKTILFERLVEAIPIALLLIYVLYLFPFLDIKFLSQTNSLVLKSIHLLILVFLAIGIVIWFFRAKFVSLYRNMQQSWKQLKKAFLPVILLSCGVWILDIIRLELVASSLNIHLPLNEIVTVSIFSFLLGLLPLTPGGLGIIEGGLISLLLYFGFTCRLCRHFRAFGAFYLLWDQQLNGLISLSYYGRYNNMEKSKKIKLH